MRIEQNWNQDDGVAKEYCDQRLPPVHARADQPGGEHVSWDAVGHADPERGIVVGCPVSFCYRNGCEIRIVERARAYRSVVAQLDSSIGIVDCCSFEIRLHSRVLS